MTAKGALAQGGLAVAALALAYATWQRKTPTDDQEVVLLPVTRAEFDRARYEDGSRWIELSWRKQGSEDVPWVRFGQKALGDAAASSHTPIREMKGSDTAHRLLEKFTPLRAVRNLGVQTVEKRKELGLEGSSRSLEIMVRNVPHRFTVSTGVLGTPYLLDAKDGKVYLVQGALLMDFDSGSNRLVDKRLHAFKASEATEAIVDAQGERRPFWVTASEYGQILKVSNKATPDKVDTLAKNWLEKAWRLYPSDLLGKGEIPSAGTPVVQAKVEYLNQGKPAGFVELARLGSESYVRSENLPGWAKVGNVDELLKDAKRVVRGP